MATCVATPSIENVHKLLQQSSTAVTAKAERNLEVRVPESWHCIDCSMDTAPGVFNRVEMEEALAAAEAAGEKGINLTIDDRCELYTVRLAVWAAAGVAPWGGCLCVGCLEKRIGRKLKPKDFLHDHPFNTGEMPATPRLRKRRKDRI